MLAVASGKGGVGKTTTAVGLARAAADRGERPLVVDADRDAPDLARALGVADEPGVSAFADGKPLVETTRTVAGFEVLPARPPVPRDVVSKALARLHGRDRPMFVDCPAGAGRPAAVPLRHAERAVVVTTLTERALSDAAKTVAMARAVDATVAGLVVTKTTREVDPDSLFDCPHLETIPAGDSPRTPARHAGAYDCALLSVYLQNI